MEEESVLREALARRDAALAEARRLDEFVRMYNELRGRSSPAKYPEPISHPPVSHQPASHPPVTHQPQQFSAPPLVVVGDNSRNLPPAPADRMDRNDRLDRGDSLAGEFILDKSRPNIR